MIKETGGIYEQAMGLTYTAGNFLKGIDHAS